MVGLNWLWFQVVLSLTIIVITLLPVERSITHGSMQVPCWRRIQGTAVWTNPLEWEKGNILVTPWKGPVNFLHPSDLSSSPVLAPRLPDSPGSKDPSPSWQYLLSLTPVYHCAMLPEMVIDLLMCVLSLILLSSALPQFQSSPPTRLGFIRGSYCVSSFL